MILAELDALDPISRAETTLTGELPGKVAYDPEMPLREDVKP